MADTDHNEMGAGEGFTVPEAIADLEAEDQAVFRRVFTSLFVGGVEERVGRYELHELIASGGMGMVYRAFDPKLERDVAVKLLAPRPRLDSSDAEILRERLMREAQALASLEHPNVVAVHDVGVDSGRVYIAMALIEGGVTLRERQQRADCSLRTRLRLYLAAGRGLCAAHDAGIVHRDFKPDNVFIGVDDGVYVGDFGLARRLDLLEPQDASGHEQTSELVAVRLTRSGDIQGTLGYMAPEQLRGEEVGPAADQFAFCVALWESLSGQLPFPGMTIGSCLEAMERAPRGGEQIPRRLSKILSTGLALEPAERYPSMAALLRALEREYERPRRMWAGGGVALVAAILAGAAGVAAHARAAAAELEAQQRARAELACEVVEQLGDPREHEGWAELQAFAGDRFDARVGELVDEARAACELEDEASRDRAVDQLRMVVEGLENFLQLEPSERADAVGELELVFAGTPFRPMNPEFSQWMSDEIAPLELEGDHLAVIERLECARVKCDGQVVKPTDLADAAELGWRYGRAQARYGDDSAALSSYRRARIAARDALDEGREFRATLELAKTSIMRAERYQAGEELLLAASGLDELDALDAALLVADEEETKLSTPQRLALLELAGMHARHAGDTARALRLQRAVVESLRAGSSENDEIPKYDEILLVSALINLGNLYDDAEEPQLAESAYREAEQLDPQEPEVWLTYGMFLQDQEDAERAAKGRVLLERLAELEGHELQLTAAMVLLEGELDLLSFPPSEGLAAITTRRERLESLLHADASRPELSPKQLRDGWMLVARVRAATGDFGSALDQAFERAPPPIGVDAMPHYAGGALEIALSALDYQHPRAGELLARAGELVRALPESLPESEQLREVLSELEAQHQH